MDVNKAGLPTKEFADGLCQENPAGLGGWGKSQRVRQGAAELGPTSSEKSTIPTACEEKDQKTEEKRGRERTD
jgi:hypothetical protein